MTPSSLLFFSTMIMGTIIALSSSNWLYLWMGMELNLLSFVPLISSSSKSQETEASVKYFIIQAIGSGLMLTAGVMATSPASFLGFQLITSILFMTSMLIKLGMSPYHQWLPHVMSSIPWSMCLMLATWQKISPMIMLTMITPDEMLPIIIMAAVASALTGGLGGINQSQMRALLAYSSIGHMGWMVTASQCSSNTFFIYFAAYIVITCSIMLIMMKSNTAHSKLTLSLTNSPVLFLMSMMVMFSLGGLPPLLGFFPKWMIISTLSTKEMMLTAMALITGSLLNLFYYFNMSFNFILVAPHTPSRLSTGTSPIMISLFATLSPLILLL